MMSSPSPHSEHASSEDLRPFVFWALKRLQLEPRADEHDVYRVSLPVESESASNGVEEAAFTFTAEPTRGGDVDGVELVAPDGRLLAWLIERLARRGCLAHFAPPGEPVGVPRITAAMFSAYTVDGGQVQLAGCTLDDRPFLRSTQPSGAADEARAYLDSAGAPASPVLVEALRLDAAEPLARPPRVAAGELAQWIGRLLAGQDADEERQDVQSVQLAWCKFAIGKLRFTIGDQTLDAPFCEWAALLEPPAVVCPHSGAKTFHLAATDDGRIAAAEEIEVCGHSGRRALRGELVRCEATGQRVLKDYTVQCPVTGEYALAGRLAACPQCGEEVVPSAIVAARCAGCRALAAVGKDEPRMARVLGEYPRLDEWRRWKIAETALAYLLQGSSLVRRILLVLDKQSLEPRRIAVRGRWAKRWRDVSESERADYL